MTRPLLQLITAATWICLLATASAQADEKWSRQLESTGQLESGAGQADNFDWVPLSQPVDDGSASKDRSANGRALTYTQAFPPNGRFGEFAKSQQPTFDFPYQFQHYPNAPPAQSLRHPQALKAASLQSQEPTSQSFFKFEMPFNAEGHRPSSVSAPSSLQTGYQIQHAFGGGAQATLFNSPLFNQNPVFPPDFHPVPPKPHAQPLQTKPLHQQNYIQDSYPLKNPFRESKPVQTLQDSLQTVTPQVFPSNPQPETLFELSKPSSFQVQSPFHQTAPAGAPAPAQIPSAPAAPNNGQQQQQQEVQLLYVPYDTLFNQQQQQQQQQQHQQQQQRPQGLPAQNPSFELNKYNINSGIPAVNPYQINQFYTPEPYPPQDIKYYTTSTTNRPYSTTTTATSTTSPAFQSFHNQPFTTQKPKPKAHQPPLAMFIVRNTARPTQSDVVAFLRNARTIAVVDAPTQRIPEIFVGPAGMPIPNGYAKFELPYLSQLSQPPRDIHDVSFFVAPLSYRTPSGFNKILLPEPHVGSIVINRAKDNVGQPQQPLQNMVIISPAPHGVGQHQSSTPRSRPNTPRVKAQRTQQSSQPQDYYPDDYLRQTSQSQKSRYPSEATSQRPPSRGNKFSYFYDQDVIQEVTSPKMTKHDRPKKKRPHHAVQVQQPVFTQNINNPYAQFLPVPNQIPNDDFYKIETTRPPSTTTSSTSTSTSTTTTSTTPSTTFFNFNTNPHVEFQSTNGHLYHDFTAVTKAPEEYVPRYTTRPPSVTTAEEEYRMKHYFRQQDAFRNRPQVVSSTNSPFELVNYTPVSLDYDRPATTQPPTTHKQRVTFYTPTAQPTTAPEEAVNTFPPRAEHNQEEAVQTENPTESNLPSNHRPAYNQNEIQDGAVEYEPNPYQLPSELPPLTANLPGLVNGLQEKDKQLGQEQTLGATPSYTQEEDTTPSTPKRRPLHRIRKPVIAKVSSSVSYSESETSSRRPSHRTRRPFGSRTSSTTPVNDIDTGEEEPILRPTRRPTSARNPLVRNPNRIRYQPTPEERQTLRIKPRKKYNSAGKAQASEDLDYQRDVLKQNYPVFHPSSSDRRLTSPTAIPSSYSAVTVTTDRAISESEQVYTVTPSNNVDNNKKGQIFPAGLLEPMQIAQEYKQYSEENYGPGYFPNQEDFNPTEPVVRNEINPVYTTVPTTTPTTTTTTATEEPKVVTTTRRSPFIRRNYPRLRPTTTEAPTTIATTTEERQSVRSRIPPRKIIKVRARTRRPHPASSTSPPQDEAEQQQEPEAKNNYRKLNRFNQDLYENDSPRHRFKPTQFQLDGQESQWSPPVKSKNNFKPLNPREERNKTTHNYESEPEIVTAGAEHDQNNEKKPDTYEVKVSAALGSSGAESAVNTLKPNLKPEKSFAELLEEVMGKRPEGQTTESDLATRTTDGTFFESQKTAINNRLNRRGKWKKLRVSVPNTATTKESFETAESQSLGSQLLNSLYDGERQTTNDELKTTTPKTSTTTTSQEFTTLLTATPAATPTSQTTADDSDLTTFRAFDSTTMTTMLPVPMDEEMEEMKLATTTLPVTTEEIATRRLDEQDLASEDDLETQPSLFSEVKRQLHELFSIEESDDQAVDSALAAVSKRRQEYTSIKRAKPDPTTTEASQNAVATTSPSSGSNADETTSDKKPFHKDLMEHVVYATATSLKVSSETEICYRGRCIRSEDLPPNHKLN